MANEYSLRCALCGGSHEVEPSNVDDLATAKQGSVYICQTCQHKVRYESEQKFS